MKKLIFILLVVLLGGGGLYLKAELNSSTDTAFKSIKTSVLNNEEQIGDVSTIKTSIIPFDMRPFADCIKDEECYFYTFSVNINAGNKNRVIYDAETSGAVVEAGLWTSLTLTPEGEELVKKKIRVVNALTPSQCIEDKECVWFAFYNLVANSIVQKEEIRQLTKWNRDVDYMVQPKEVENYNIYRQEVSKSFDAIKFYFPYEISYGVEFDYLVWFTKDMKHDVNGPYRKFFDRITNGNNAIAKALNSSKFAKTEKVDCYKFPIDDEESVFGGAMAMSRIENGWGNHCINEAIMYNLGFSSSLVSFPFSITNMIEKKEQAQKLTNLDKFLITLLYQDKFKAGMKTSVEILRPAFEQAYPKALKQYNGIKTGENNG